MKRESIYRCDLAEERLASITAAIRSRIGVQLRDHELSTSFAKTHAVEGGNPEGPPLVVLHGGGTNGVFALFFLRSLLDRYRIFAVDIPGHPGGSECVFIDPRENDNGLWLQEVVDALGLAEANYLGISWGGFVVQRFAAVAPHRISKAVFLVPAGIVNPPTWPVIRDFLIPRAVARWRGNPIYLHPFFKKLFTDFDDPLGQEYFETYFMAVKADMRMMKRSQPEEMAGFLAPKLIVGAEEDIFFPAREMAARCDVVFPEPCTFHLLHQTKHSPSMKEEALIDLGNTIDGFLRD